MRRENIANIIRHIFFLILLARFYIFYGCSWFNGISRERSIFRSAIRRGLIARHCDRSEIIVALIYASPSFPPWIQPFAISTTRLLASPRAIARNEHRASGNFRAAFMPFMREVRRTQNTRAPFPACFPRDVRTRGMPRTPVKS